MMDTRNRLTWLIYGMTNAVLFGAGIIPVLSIPALAAYASYLIPVVVVAAFVLAVPVAWIIAPRMRARYWRWREARMPRPAGH